MALVYSEGVKMASISKKLIILLITCFMFSIYSPAMADESIKTDEMKGDWVIWDLALARPAGVVSIGLGTALFMVSLPFTLPSKSVKTASKKLIMDPINYTFKRPLGQWPVEY